MKMKIPLDCLENPHNLIFHSTNSPFYINKCRRNISRYLHIYPDLKTNTKELDN